MAMRSLTSWCREIEKRFRGIGKGWARFMYGGSTGGWEALAAQIFYPDEYNGAWGACPDPIDFRAYTVVNIYEHENAYYADSKWKQIATARQTQLPGRTGRDCRRHESHGACARNAQPFWRAVGHLAGRLFPRG